MGNCKPRYISAKGREMPREWSFVVAARSEVVVMSQVPSAAGEGLALADAIIPHEIDRRVWRRRRKGDDNTRRNEGALREQ